MICGKVERHVYLFGVFRVELQQLQRTSKVVSVHSDLLLYAECVTALGQPNIRMWLHGVID